MYSKPVLSACAASSDGAFVAGVCGSDLYVWKWGAGEWEPDVHAELETGVKYLSLSFSRANLEVLLAGSDGQVRACTGLDARGGHPVLTPHGSRSTSCTGPVASASLH
jgi:hypothetical protein